MFLRLCCVTDTSDVRGDTYHRIILFSAIIRLLYKDYADAIPVRAYVALDWDTEPLLRDMPSYAVAKYTYRGKNGCSTKQFKDQGTMSDEIYENLHGHKLQKGLQDLFTEGSLIKEPCLQTNPYRQTTIKVYSAAPEGKQRTMFLTTVFYEQLFAQRKELLTINWSDPGA